MVFFFFFLQNVFKNAAEKTLNKAAAHNPSYLRRTCKHNGGLSLSALFDPVLVAEIVPVLLFGSHRKRRLFKSNVTSDR